MEIFVHTDENTMTRGIRKPLNSAPLSLRKGRDRKMGSRFDFRQPDIRFEFHAVWMHSHIICASIVVYGIYNIAFSWVETRFMAYIRYIFVYFVD